MFRTSPPSAEPITLAEAKTQIRVDAEQIDEDGLIQAFISAAREFAETFTGLEIDGQTIKDDLGQTYPLPHSIRAAMLLMIEFLYENRGDESKAVPSGIEALLRFYRIRKGCA
ncbi:head-tail connector protein [Diaphorobacter caeni]|uniref:head-tail connector protein n=1 Tax=Diaphorobacter caeni TaxID=2784387 RepID=UPI00188E513E|nr:head-tail connector protein [Diaphorobacter caeni]MBF5006003.1 phage gp6-like head-tail connector protein [Diaphorobacter caeni]